MTKKRGSGKKKRRNDNSKLLYLFIGAVFLLSSALYLLVREEFAEKKTIPAQKDAGQYADIPSLPAAPPFVPVKIKEIKPEEKTPVALTPLPKLSIIIDDIGYNKSYIDLINLGVPITLAIIPFTPYSKDAAMRGNSAGIEMMLHMPMEPKENNGSNPDKDALSTTMDGETIIKKLRAALNDVPHVRGVNNHMGSKFTEYSWGMQLVLQELKVRGLFFVDSKTSPGSTGYSLARKMGIRTAERSVFIDNVRAEESIKKQLMKAVKIAKTHGEAIAIGHPYQATVSTLKKVAPTLEDNGVELVVASAITR